MASSSPASPHPSDHTSEADSQASTIPWPGGAWELELTPSTDVPDSSDFFSSPPDGNDSPPMVAPAVVWSIFVETCTSPSRTIVLSITNDSTIGEIADRACDVLKWWNFQTNLTYEGLQVCRHRRPSDYGVYGNARFVMQTAMRGGMESAAAAAANDDDFDEDLTSTSMPDIEGINLNSGAASSGRLAPGS
jgi:hypothetical protein